MKKIAFVFTIFLFINFSVTAQNILVKGKPYSGKLSWKDFSGKPDANSSFDAFTSFKFQTHYNNLRFDKDTADLSAFTIDLEFDVPKSWVKKGKQTDYLLKHEQGHFDISILMVHELLAQVKSARFTKFNFQSGINKLVNVISEKYRKMGLAYDKETDHSKNITGQLKWDAFIEKALEESKTNL